ncbi:uncharacterized protein [Physcomitrium patens]|nr:uncharacterized protein LOC112291539 isoform X2 [Physcomitrium patens]|eukprot:XP_024394866.1 uncharacterized protein LOC112291539 isoform X2 [Physcomitrella patens]
MEAPGEVKKEPVPLKSAAGKETGRAIKRKRAASESEHSHKRSHGASGTNSKSRMPSKVKAPKDAGAVISSAWKRKRSNMVEEDPELDSEHVMNAAQALFDLFAGAGIPRKDTVESKPGDVKSGGVKWAGKKSRSSRCSKKADDSCACKLSSSSTTSATVTDIPEILDSSTSRNHQLVVSHPHASEAGVETVHVEVDSEADADAKSTDMSPCGLDFDRGYRLLSQSSVESTLLDSRAESPSSPLRVLRSEADLIPKLEEELMLQFGFQRNLPVRPVTKPSLLRKPKAEENCTIEGDEMKEAKVALKQVQRRKSRASNVKGQSLILQGDVLDVPTTSSGTVLKECIEENKFQVPVTLNLFEPVKTETGRVKLEGRELYQTGSSTQVRLRSALSEAEKEARRLRRVQANRESARQTIRRKQVLCEELARKAGELQAEKDNLSKTLEQKAKELRNHQEINRHLKEQILLQSGSAETSLPANDGGNSASPAPAAGPVGGMPMLPYWWAFALAQSVAATQSSGVPQLPEGVVVPPDFNVVFAATVAALNNGAAMNPNMWMNLMGNMSKAQVPGMVAAPDQQATLTHSAARPSVTSELPPAGGTDRFQVLGRSPVAKSSASSSPMKGVTNTDATVIMSKPSSQVSGKIPSGLPSMLSTSHSRGKYQVASLGAPASHSLQTTGSGMTQYHVAGDGIASASTTLSLGPGSHQLQQSGRMDQLRKAGNLRFFPTIGNGVQGFLGPRVGAYQSEAAAKATEARRRRRELKRTKSLQSQLQQEKKLVSTKSL